MLGMGVTLEPKDFTQVFKSPKIIILGVALQFLIMPAWSALLAWGLGLSPELAVGIILVACCPGGTASNVVVFLKARVALSVSLTLCSTVTAVVLTPWLTFLYAGHYIPIEPWALLRAFYGLSYFHWQRDHSKGLFSCSSKKGFEFSPVLSVLFIFDWGIFWHRKEIRF